MSSAGIGGVVDKPEKILNVYLPVRIQTRTTQLGHNIIIIVTIPSFFLLFPDGIISRKNEWPSFHTALLNVYQWLFLNSVNPTSPSAPPGVYDFYEKQVAHNIYDTTHSHWLFDTINTNVLM